MYRINPTVTFREHELILLDEADSRRVARGVRSGPGSNPIGVVATALSFLMTLIVLAGVVLVALSTPAHAETTFSVSSTGDQSDANLDDGICSDLSGACTFRAAIEQANKSAGADVINFDIPGTSVHTINPTRGSGLPAITERVTIDGYTQPGATPNTLANGSNAQLKIELDGTNAGSNGLFIDTGGSGSVIKGLVINRFSSEGIRAQDSSQNEIEGNFIGTDPSGTIDLGNGGGGGGSGVLILVTNSSTSNTVGGTSPDKRNLISGNNGFGVRFATVLGGTTSFNRVEGNLIGTKKDGTTALANSFDGVEIGDASNNTVSGNTIAFNDADGVAILGTPNSDKADGNFLAGNSIFSNGDLGIDLANNGVTPNDGDNPNTAQLDPDSDTGPNDLQNFPLITSAKTTKKGTTVKGTLNSAQNKTFIVQFFSNANGDEGQKFIGQVGVSTDSSGNASFTFKPAKKVTKGKITATATDTASKNTSEFSAARKVVVRKRR